MLPLIFFAAWQTFAVPLEALLPPSQVQYLRSSGELLIEIQQRNSPPLLMPRNEELRQFVNREINALNPTMMVEILYLYKKPAQYYTAASVWDDSQKAGVFNQVLAISTMTGLHYYSASRGVMRLFYEIGHVVDGSAARNPLPDPVFSQPPANLTLFARQKDLTFGDNIYRYDYITTDNAIYFIQENITTMSVGVLPAIGKNNLRSVVSILDCGDSILIYGVSMAKVIMIPGFWNRISASFSNRAEAILKWFTGNLAKELFI